MSSPLTQAGAVTDPSRYAPLHTNRFFTGLWTNRNPLRDAATSYLQEKFYAGSRFDSLIDGLNCEITSKLTLAKRYGNSVYNSQTFGPVNRFYDFRIFSTTSESIRVIADEVTKVYDATGPSTRQELFTKSAGAGPTYFQSVGNSLYMGTGADQKKWLKTAKVWAQNYTFPSDETVFIVDPNLNLQVLVGANTMNVSSFSISGNVVTVVLRENLPWRIRVGVSVTMAALATGTYLNGQALTITSTTFNSFTAAFVHADVGSTNDSGTASTVVGVTAGIEPTWSTTLRGVTTDNTAQWICYGSSIQQWGIDAPAAAPSVTNTTMPSAYPNWAASTYYAPVAVIVDSNNNIQEVTIAGATGAAEPIWAVIDGNTTVDAGVTWTCRGAGTRANLTAYALRKFIKVTKSTTVIIRSGRTPNDAVGGHQLTQDGSSEDSQSYTVTTNLLFMATVAGTSGSSVPNFPDALNATVQDGGVTWQNIGTQHNWAYIGALTAISLATVVLDTNGAKQTITVAGKSSAVAPTWKIVEGETTTDNTAQWLHSGAFSAANTTPWYYAVAYKNTLTGHVCTRSDQSENIIKASGKMIAISGVGSTDPQVDRIQIYRTEQNGGILLLLDEIPNVDDGSGWTYYDTIPDKNLVTTKIAEEANDPPPAGAIAPCYHLRRLFVAVGNTVYYSGLPVTGVGVESFYLPNNFVFPSKVVRMWSTSIGLLVFTTSDLYIILGKTTATFYAVMFLKGVGLLNYDAFSVHGTSIYLMTNAEKFISLDPSAGLIEVGFPIGDTLKSQYDPTTAYVTYHEGSSDDTALFVADGATGWYRMAATAAPETGIVWSPRAIITGGCKCVQSIETTPGSKSLLIGPLVSGPILMRDSTVTQDNASDYVWSATFGSIVLAQPGRVAEIDFLTLDSRKVGTKPTIGVLLGEISGTFETCRRTCPDPPLLPQSLTLHNDRYYMAQNQKPTYCRHFQMQINCIAENVRHEILGYAIFGALRTEKRAH